MRKGKKKVKGKKRDGKKTEDDEGVCDSSSLQIQITQESEGNQR